MNLPTALERAHPAPSLFRTWGRLDATLRGLTFDSMRKELLDRSVGPERKNMLLAALLRVGRTDERAWLALVICLLPGLRRAERRFGSSLDEDEAWAVLVAELWERMCSYDLNRRPERIAANLIWDATAALVRARRTEARWADQTTALADIAGQVDEPGLSAAALWDLAVDAGVLDTADVGLIDATRLGGLSLIDAARLLGLGYEAAKKRRQRAEAGWAAWWAPERCPGVACRYAA